jgi:exodeoxyribonuclease VII large subunit
MSNEPAIFTVSQLTQAIKLQLEQTFPMIQLQGEISNFRRQSSGHLYFSLKDAHAQIGAVLFARNAAMLNMDPKDGDQVLVEGELNVYAPSGKYQLMIHKMRLVGLGELLLKLEALKREILRRGWFSKEHKKPLPKLPKTIGVVTSPTGAVIRDILNVLTRRFSGVRILLNPVKVQGEGAASEIARAIEEFNRYELADVLIVGRGGGSMEDLWPFNEEIAASAVFHSKIPIIAAVGHETDHCIVEYVADVRAPTPSAAAEIAIGEKEHLFTSLMQIKRRLDTTINFLLRKMRDLLRSMQRQPLFSSPYSLLAQQIQHCDNLSHAIHSAMAHRLNQLKIVLTGKRSHLAALSPIMRLKQQKGKLLQTRAAYYVSQKRLLERLHEKLATSKFRRQLIQKWQERLLRSKEKLAAVASALEAVNPKVLLNKGYCIVRDVSSAKELEVGQALQLIFSDGEAEAVVQDVRMNTM